MNTISARSDEHLVDVQKRMQAFSELQILIGDSPGTCWSVRRNRKGPPILQERDVRDPESPLVAVLPASRAFLRQMSLPRLTGKKLRMLLPHRLDQELPFAIESCRADFQTSTGVEGVFALGAAALETDVRDQLQLWKSHGWEPDAMSVEALGWWALLESYEKGPKALLALEPDRVALIWGNEWPEDVVVHHREGVPGAGVDDSMRPRIARWLHGASGSLKTAETIYVSCARVGEGGAHAEDFLAEWFPHISWVRLPASDCPLAEGVARSFWSGTALNLLLPEESSPLSVRLRRTVQRTQRWGLLVGLLLPVLVCAGSYFYLRQLNDRQANQLKDAFQSFSGQVTDTPSMMPLLAERSLQELQADSAMLSSAFSHETSRHWAMILQSAHSRGVQVHRLMIQGGRFEISGSAASAAAAEGLAATARTAGLTCRLETSGTPETGLDFVIRGGGGNE